MKPIILIKLGGSSITDKSTPYKVRRNVIKELAREIKKSGDRYSLVISHGSGSFGHTSASKFGGIKGYKSKIGIASVSADAARINQIVTDIFIEEGIPIVSLSPMSMIISKNGKQNSNSFQVIEEILKQGLIPLVYGDVIWDTDWKSTIFSGERVLSEIATYLLKRKYKISKMIEVGETAGLLDEKGKTIPVVNRKNWKVLSVKIFTNGKTDVTGGMRHKIEGALELSKDGIKTEIISDKKHNLYNAIMGKLTKGTIVSKI